MEFPICPPHIQALKHRTLIAEIVVMACTNVQAARNHRPADVIVYVKGDVVPPGSVDHGARATVTWMYAQIGISLDWSDGSAGSVAASSNSVSIQVLFVRDGQNNATPGALAYTPPFTRGVTVINVLYNRVRLVTDKSALQQAILAHVLAHEIGHVLQVTNQHAQTGVMKAHWNGQDYAAMEKRPLAFTSDDVDLIVQGLAARKARTAGK